MLRITFVTLRIFDSLALINDNCIDSEILNSISITNVKHNISNTNVKDCKALLTAKKIDKFLASRE